MCADMPKSDSSTWKEKAETDFMAAYDAHADALRHGGRALGHALVADALEFGMAETVRKYLAACAA